MRINFTKLKQLSDEIVIHPTLDRFPPCLLLKQWTIIVSIVQSVKYLHDLLHKPQPAWCARCHYMTPVRTCEAGSLVLGAYWPKRRGLLTHTFIRGGQHPRRGGCTTVRSILLCMIWRNILIVLTGGAGIERLARRCVCLNVGGKFDRQGFSFTISLLRVSARMNTFVTRDFVRRRSFRQGRSRGSRGTLGNYSSATMGMDFRVIVYCKGQRICRGRYCTSIMFFRPARHRTPGKTAWTYLRFHLFTLHCCRYKTINIYRHTTVPRGMMGFHHFN